MKINRTILYDPKDNSVWLTNEKIVPEIICIRKLTKSSKRRMEDLTYTYRTRLFCDLIFIGPEKFNTLW